MGENLPRRQRRRRRTVGRVTGALALLLVLATAGVLVVTSHGNGTTATVVRHAPVTSEVPVPVPDVHADLGVVPLRAAATKGGDITVYDRPDTGAQPLVVLSKETYYELPRTLLAFDQYQDWLHVYLPTRPNSSVGWVKATDVALSAPLEWEVRVSLAAHELWMLHDGNVVLDAPVAIGTAATPTPTGTFYVTDPIDLRNIPGTGYGAYAFGLSGHSDVLSEFNGGDGQIAIHGTDNPSDVGKDVSHGCVRMTNDTVVKLAVLPLGTPVIIT